MANTKKAEIEETVNVEEFVPAVEEKVLVKIPLDRSTEEDPVVWVNNRRFTIKRGVPVEVPESVAEILREQEKMLQVCYEYDMAHSK